jgi:hypothetical protein
MCLALLERRNCVSQPLGSVVCESRLHADVTSVGSNEVRACVNTPLCYPFTPLQSLINETRHSSSSSVFPLARSSRLTIQLER